MDKEIISAIVELVKTGGTYAIWGIVAYGFMREGRVLTMLYMGILQNG